LTFAAGGTNQNVTVTPSGAGNTILNGNVGIGTASPTTKLHVAGSFRLENGTQAAGRLLTSDANGVATWQTASGALPTGTGGQTLRHDGANWVANSNLFNNGTNVGIGTSAPGAKLDVYATGGRGVSANDGTSWISLVPSASTWDYSGLSSPGDMGLFFSVDGSTNSTASNGLVIGPDCAWSANGYAGIKIMENGNVGINTPSPAATFHVAGTTNLNGNTVVNELGASTDFRVESAGNPNMLFVSGGNNRVGIGTESPGARLDVLSPGTGGRALGATDGSSWMSFVPDGCEWCYSGLTLPGDMALIFSTDNSTNSTASNGLVIGPDCAWSANGYAGIKIMENGNVGINTPSPGYLLTVNGQPAANGFTAFTNYSDSRLKTNISSIDTGALSKIMQLRPVSFQYNQKYLQLYPNSDLQKVHKGFIAQEIRQVFPEMVSEMKTTADSVQYLDLDVSHLQVYLVKAIQEQQVIIDAQKKEIETLKVQASNASHTSVETSQKLSDLEGKMNALLLLLNGKTEVTVKQ
jgi:hypothetical protein